MTIIKSETRETYTVPGQPHIVTVSPPWELLPAPDEAPPLLDMFAADLVLDCAVKWLRARNDSARRQSNGAAAMQAYLDAEDLLAGAVTIYDAVTTPMDEDEECQIP